jgi:hypothetical protein
VKNRRQVFPALDPGSADDVVSKMFWKLLSDFSGSHGRPIISGIEWPEPFESGAIAGIDVSRKPSVCRNLLKSTNFDFWQSLKSQSSKL